MKQIASPGVAMDVKTGKVITAETGLMQVRNHSAGVQDMRKLHLLIQGTQSAAKHYMVCMAHQSGRKQMVSHLQQSVAVDSIGGSEVSHKDDKTFKKMTFSNPKARCKGQPVKIKGKKGL